jgi:hypothetical protein
MSQNNCESGNANNITVVENLKPYGLFDAPSSSAFFSLLVELEKKEEEDFEIGPLPKFVRQSNNPALWRNDGLDYVPPRVNEPLICDVDLSSNAIWPPIPKLERQTNMPDGINLPVIDLFSEEEHMADDEIVVPFIECCEICKQFDCVCDLIFSECQCGKMYNIYESDECDDCLGDKTALCHCGKTYNIYESDECKSCLLNKTDQCECGKTYYLDESYRGMCFDCEILEREQDLIDQILHLDDIPDIYRYDSD